VLQQLVGSYGTQRWSYIASFLPGRQSKQCRERWHNHLNPDIRKDAWTIDEDRILIEQHAELGNQWSEIARKLPGRTDNAVKNRYYSRARRWLQKPTHQGKREKRELTWHLQEEDESETDNDRVEGNEVEKENEQKTF